MDNKISEVDVYTVHDNVSMIEVSPTLEDEFKRLPSDLNHLILEHFR